MLLVTPAPADGSRSRFSRFQSTQSVHGNQFMTNDQAVQQLGEVIVNVSGGEGAEILPPVRR